MPKNERTFPYVPNFIGNGEMLGVYLASIVRTFAISLTGIFVPIYVSKLYSHLPLNEAVVRVVLYFILMEVASLLMAVPAGKIILRLGFRYSIFIGNVLLALANGSLILAQNNHGWLVAAAICEGVSLHFFWNCYHLTFAKQADKHHLGRQISLDGIFGTLVSAIAPAFGGMIATLFGFTALLILSLSLIIISSFPLALVVDGKGYHLGDYCEIVKGYFSRKFRGFMWGFFFEGARGYVAWIAWPLFLLAVVKGSYDYLGFIVSATLIVSVIFCFFSGKLVDHGNETGGFTLGALFISFFWILRIPITNPGQVFLVQSGGNMSESLYRVSWAATVYRRISGITNSYLYVVLREIALRLGSLWGLLIAYTVSRAGFPLQTTFVFAALLPICTLSSLTVFDKPRSFVGRLIDRFTAREEL
ncbi:hypothetical protein COT51_03800 [candidate division WWE3 bacterium CG08_land_8_20_14_0_20_41_15]|uniref:Major facilitator superfamily (MFS) profile domain-containing protein n=1 Tax=candidate division WWE3 bacterium CG08_land_8_20_14_0_20_41_15 TaxID=1975086 RepID=A0A2H0X8S5_UNCKA|nr:MAG: hypothetical protein COT51_03800 [candidate division WWE3 bacterium CG08_land_8_20_14_0_20_41_15]